MSHSARTPEHSVVSAFSVDELARLQTGFRGDVILPGDSEYDTARRVHITVHERYPSVIVRPIDADDVAHAVQFAVDKELPIAVRGGSHSAAGYGTVDAGLVIDLSRMRAITVDSAARIARAEGGITAGEFIAATSAHGLYAPFGDSPGVGVGGITLGGGVGWLTRKFGMTINSLVAVEIVTADGHKLRVSETEHSDLFWAVRGGGNFGVVTLFEFKLHPLDTVLGGMLFFSATPEIVRGVLELSANAPDELTTISTVMRMNAMPTMPEVLHNRLVLMVSLVWSGDLETGARVLAPFRALAAPLLDGVRPMSFSAMYEENGGAPPYYNSVARSFMAKSIDDAAIAAILAQFEPDRLPSQSSMKAAQIRVLGGAMARVPADATAFAHRDAPLMVIVAAAMFDTPEYAAHQTWVKSLFTAIRHHASGAYVNFVEEGAARVNDVYPQATYQRLAQVKRRYDPDNRFHVNLNISPVQR